MGISLAQLVTLLTVAGVAVYVLGLVGLAFSINLTFAKNWSTAWYAVSLMPRTMVAGQGVRIWRQGWIRFVVVLVGFISGPVIITYVAPVIAGAIARVTGNSGILGELGIYVGIMLSSFLAIFLVIWVLGRVYLWISVLTINRDSDTLPYRTLSGATAMSLWIIGLGMSIAGGYLAFKGLRLDSHAPANWDMIIGAILIFLVGGFFVAIPAAADLVSNPLPRVTLIGEGESGEATPKTVGWLVAHSDGYWHLFDSRHVLLSIPDERVNEARVDDPEIGNIILA